MRRLIDSNQDGLWLDPRLTWLLLFVVTTLVVAVASWSLACQHGLPEFALGVFVFWLALFAGITLFTRRMAARPRSRR